MQQLEMWLDVLTWLGWTDIRPNTAPHDEYKGLIGTKDGRNLPIPELTLDALWEAEEKLMKQPVGMWNTYANYIAKEAHDEYGNSANEADFAHVAKTKRLLALWRTVRNSSTRTTPAVSETSQ